MSHRFLRHSFFCDSHVHRVPTTSDDALRNASCPAVHLWGLIVRCVAIHAVSKCDVVLACLACMHNDW